MNELIKQIEEMISELMNYDMSNYAAHAQDFVNSFIELLPAIINCYNDPKMSDFRQDALYWPGQMERIIRALESHDRFEAVDVLYNETYPNLEELKGMLLERGIL